MPADGTKAAHLANGNLGMSRLEQLLEMIQHVLVCKEGIAPPISGNGTFETSTNVRSIGRFRGVHSTGQCNTSRSLSAGVSKPKVFRGR